MEREVGGGIGMGNTCKPMAVSFQCMTKFTTNKKKKGCVICISKVIDTSPGSNDSSLCFIQPSVSHDVLCI